MTVQTKGATKASSCPHRVLLRTAPESDEALGNNAIVMIARRRHRRASAEREAHCSTVRSSTTLIFFIAIVVSANVLGILSIDSEHPGPFAQFTGAQPTFHMCLCIVLHLVTLATGLSRTVVGCRVAMAIAWLFFLFSVALMLFTPAFVGSYVASGVAPRDNSTTVRHLDTATERFYQGFALALGGQCMMFLVLLGAIFQMTVVAELLREAHHLEDTQIFAAHAAHAHANCSDEESFIPPPI
ncbi:unnamed protein product [Caenorhabditis sp. 36 PRJEB53466]|nr:unnamed protein product [Caenorhabditis sp. 36 PRJEB53466]